MVARILLCQIASCYRPIRARNSHQHLGFDVTQPEEYQAHEHRIFVYQDVRHSIEMSTQAVLSAWACPGMMRHHAGPWGPFRRHLVRVYPELFVLRFDTAEALQCPGANNEG